MLNQQEIDIIQRYVADQATEKEVIWIENLFAKGPSSPGLHKLLKDDWSTLAPEPEINLTHLLDRIHHAIRLKELEKQQSTKNWFIHIYSRVAAVLLVPVLLAGLWLYFMPKSMPEILVEQTVTNSIYAPMGSRVAFNLPDGTTGFLNSGSTLTYTIPFAINRSVELEGEAWFNVAHDEQHPFEISAGTSAVRVLGTSFNLYAYPNENYLELVLAEGSVEFLANAATSTIKLEPSERLVFTGGGITIEKADPAKFRGWTEGKLIFRGDNMAEVARRLERWYNVDVEIADNELEEYIFRGTFEDDNLEDVLQLLSMTSRIRYWITPRRQIEGDKWSKEKVTFFFRNN